MLESWRQHYDGSWTPDGRFVAADTMFRNDIGDWIGAEVGYALHVGRRWAAGATVAVETGNETTRFLVRFPVRRWLIWRLYAEAIPGVFRQEADLVSRSGDALERNVGYSMEARVGWADFLFASARYDLVIADPVSAPVAYPPGQVRYDPGGIGGALSLGGGIAGRTGMVTSAVTLLVGGVLLAVFAGPIA